jgi:predicted nucleic acid-binding protein
MIVADTNLIAYLYLTSPHSAQAARVLRREPDWRAPRLWRSEFANVLTAYLRRGWLTLPKATEISEQAQIYMQGAEYEVAGWRVLSLAAASGCSAYDCEFVALALDLHAPLVTADAAVLRAFPDIAVALDAFGGE